MGCNESMALIIVKLQASDHIATAYAELRNASAGAKVGIYVVTCSQLIIIFTSNNLPFFANRLIISIFRQGEVPFQSLPEPWKP